MMQYKGYVARVDLDPEANVLHGEVLGIRDVVTFEGRTPAEAEAAFRDSVDDYLRFCADRGEPPDRPFSGKFVTRLDPRLHRMISSLAQAEGKSLNAWVAERLAEGLMVPTSIERRRKVDRRGRNRSKAKSKAR